MNAQPENFGSKPAKTQRNRLRLTVFSADGDDRADDYQLAFDNLFAGVSLGLYQADRFGRSVNRASGNGHAVLPDGDFAALPHLAVHDLSALSKSWQQAMESGLEWSQELTYVAQHGAVMRVQATVGPLFDRDGSLIGFLGCNTDITARQTALEELAASDERHRLAIEAYDAGVWDFDIESYRCFFSPRSIEMLGYQQHELSGDLLAWREIVHPDDLAAARQAKRDCIDGTLPGFKIELRIKTSSGKWRWFLCHGKSRRDSSGRVLRVVGTLVDISEQKKVEKLLRMEKNLIDLITTASPVGIIFVENDGNIAFANPCAERILGLTRNEMIRTGYQIPVCPITHGTSAAAVDELPLRAVLENGSTLAHTCLPVKRPDGRRVLLTINAAPFLDSDGEIGGTVLIMDDVTEQRQHEQVLADSDRLLRETQKIAQLGSYVLNLTKDQWACSNTLLEILGVDDKMPMTLLEHYEIVHPDFRNQFIDGYINSIMDNRHFEMEYKIIRRSDAAERWVVEYCELKLDESGRLCRMVGMIQDITERKDAEDAIRDLNDDLDRRVLERTAQLAAAKKEMESFSYSVSHDLRAPLRHINSYSSILTEDFGEALPIEGRYYLERIRSASTKMGRLIDDLLTLSRVGRTEMKRARFDISQLASDVANMLRETENHGDCEIVIQKGLSADGDSVLVRQVLQNLLGNSLKYASQRGGKIEFGKTRVHGKSAFFVRDNGVGFDMAYAANLFRPFQRLHGSEFEGTGIGLATVKRIVERHGGSVWAEATENVGATFYFTLSGPSQTCQQL